MLSERARQQWTSYAHARSADLSPFGDRDELHRFLVGLHLRGEVLAAGDLKGLLDEAGVAGQEREELVALVESGLALLEAYDRVVEAEDSNYDDADEAGWRI
ncbi:MAG: hypothetical protein ACRD0N_13645 [Acidimicrobiales bacterium]